MINEFADLYGENLDVSGGLEPLLSPSILGVLKSGLDRKLKVSLYTNGIALDTPDLLDYLLKIDKIRFSLNAYNKESYKNIVGVDKFDVVKHNLIKIIRGFLNFRIISKYKKRLLYFGKISKFF